MYVGPAVASGAPGTEAGHDGQDDDMEAHGGTEDMLYAIDESDPAFRRPVVGVGRGGRSRSRGAAAAARGNTGGGRNASKVGMTYNTAKLKKEAEAAAAATSQGTAGGAASTASAASVAGVKRPSSARPPYEEEEDEVQVVDVPAEGRSSNTIVRRFSKPQLLALPPDVASEPYDPSPASARKKVVKNATTADVTRHLHG